MTERILSEERLRDRYRTRVSPKLAALEEIISTMESGPVVGAELDKLKLFVHKIHGSAGSFEFDDASRIAAEWELWLRTFSERTTIESEDIERMRKMLSDLRNSMA